MDQKVKPRPTDDEVLVYEHSLRSGSGELADGDGTNNSEGSETFRGSIVAGGGTEPFTFVLMSSATGSYGTLDLDPNTGAYTYTLSRTFDSTPDADDGRNVESGGDVFSYRVMDATGEVGTGTIVISIVDDVPTAASDTNAVAENASVSGNLLTDGTGDLFGADGPSAAGGLIGVAAETGTIGPVSGGVGVAIAGHHGTLTVAANGSYSYKANANATSGGTVVDRFVYTIRDGDGDTSTATLAINVSDAGGSGGTGGFNVRDFGAKGDGITNDQAAIQAAINAAHAGGGGVVDVPAGTYMIGLGGPQASDGPIELLTGVTLRGAGIGATVLKLMDNVTQQINGFVRTPYGEVVHHVGLLDLTLDGNRANNTVKVNALLTGVAPGSTLAVEDVTVNRVEARNFSGYGFDPHERTVRLTIENSVAHHNGLDGFVADFQIDGVFRNNVAYANDRHGFNIVTSTTNFLLENNTAYANGGTGITIQRGSDPTYAFTNHITVTGGEIFGNTGAGIEVKLSADVVLSSISIHDNAKEGIKISGATGVTVTNNTIEDNGLGSSSGFYNAVTIADQIDTFSGTTFTSGHIVVQNNTIISDAAIRPGYGIAELSAVTALADFTGNSIVGMKNGDVIADGQRYDESGALVGGGGGNGVYDVKVYGAKGDGVTDDTAAIQAAIDAAYAAGGGTVIIAAGTYRVSGTADKSDGCIRLLDNVTVQGAGAGQTIVKVIDNNPYAITGVIRTPFNDITHDVGLKNLTIDGNRANNTSKIDGFYCGVAPNDTRQDYNITIDGVEVMNCSGYGFDPHEQTLNLRIANSSAHHNGLDGFVADFLIGSVYENNLSYANDRHGFNITTSTDGLLLLNNTAYGNGSAGLAIQRGSEAIPNPHDIIVEGGSYYSNAREGIYVKIADEITITGAEVFGNKRQGIRIDGATSVLVDGARVFNNSQEGAGLYDEIRLSRYNDTTGASGLYWDTTGVTVQNSTIYADAAIRSRYAIYEAPDVEGINRASGNIISGTAGGTTYFAPQLVTAPTNQAAITGTAFTYQLATSTFVDGDNESYAVSAKLASGAALPSWLTFNPATRQFTGTPPSSGTLQILVEARDARGLKDTATFDIVIAPGGATIDGTSAADTLIGTAASEIIRGLAGNDTLNGNGGDDRLDGGAGTDQILGGAGADTFEFKAGNQEDIIGDFDAAAGDRIDLTAFAWINSLIELKARGTQTSGGVVFDLGNNDKLTLTGVSLNSVSASNVILTGAFNANLPPDPVWRHQDGTVLIWRRADVAGGFASQEIKGMSTEWQIAQVADFNGDGNSDILWRHQSGSTLVWNSTAQLGGFTGTTVTGFEGNWQAQHAGDFNGDGKDDLLWRNAEGRVIIWSLNPGPDGYKGQDIVGIGNEWQVQEVADFNGDRKDDLLWRHSDGTVIIWNSAAQAGAYVAQDIIGIRTEWRIVEAADFNGDGKGDILWRHIDGSVLLWHSSGQPGGYYAQDILGIGNEWQIQKAADFNLDGKADLLWRHDSGTVIIWNSSAQPGGYTEQVIPGLNNEWDVL